MVKFLNMYSSNLLIAIGRTFLHVMVISSFFSMAAAQELEPTVDDSPLIAISAARIIVDPQLPAIEGGVILVRGNKIVEVGTSSSVRAAGAVETIDLGSRTVLPGLIDSHAHLSTSHTLAKDNASIPLASLRAVKGIEQAASMGITTMRIVGSRNFIDVGLRDAVNEGLIAGPRIIPAGHPLSPPGGSADGYTFPASIPLDDYYVARNGFVNSVEDAQKAVNLQFKYGAEVIKVNASGGYSAPLDNPHQVLFTEQELAVIADSAHRHGMKATAHAENAVAVKAAVRAGFDSIDHGTELDDEAIDMMLERGVCLVPTLFVPEFVLGLFEEGALAPPVAHKLQQYPMDGWIPSFQKAHQAGVRVAAGSDGNYGSGPSINLITELETFVKYGMTPGEAVAAATVDAAVCIGLDNLIGTLEKGKSADLIALEGDPLEDITALRQVDFVMREGCILSSAIDDVVASPCN